MFYFHFSHFPATKACYWAFHVLKFIFYEVKMWSEVVKNAKSYPNMCQSLTDPTANGPEVCQDW